MGKMGEQDEPSKVQIPGFTSFSHGEPPPRSLDFPPTRFFFFFWISSTHPPTRSRAHYVPPRENYLYFLFLYCSSRNCT